MSASSTFNKNTSILYVINFSLLDDYDINFPETKGHTSIVLGTIDTDFNELTFSAWFKFNPGFITKYPFVSYVTGDSTETFALGFCSDDFNSGLGEDDSEQTIDIFFGNLFGQHRR